MEKNENKNVVLRNKNLIFFHFSLFVIKLIKIAWIGSAKGADMSNCQSKT